MGAAGELQEQRPMPSGPWDMGALRSRRWGVRSRRWGAEVTEMGCEVKEVGC